MKKTGKEMFVAYLNVRREQLKREGRIIENPPVWEQLSPETQQIFERVAWKANMIVSEMEVKEC